MQKGQAKRLFQRIVKNIRYWAF